MMRIDFSTTVRARQSADWASAAGDRRGGTGYRTEADAGYR